jgi:hypothetical protein
MDKKGRIYLEKREIAKCPHCGNWHIRKFIHGYNEYIQEKIGRWKLTAFVGKVYPIFATTVAKNGKKNKLSILNVYQKIIYNLK